MAKIAKIRFINFTYNENRHIYDQTLDFYGGEDTLLNLQNGGGKTVLVQMMLQPIIPKQKLKDRLFKSYFLNAKAPVYIMIEWILDGTSKRILTGIGIKRVQGKSIEDESNSIKIVTFISEYEGGSNYNIKNIGLTYEEKGVIKLHDFDRVVRELSDAEKEGEDVWVFRWNTADDKREYARRLTEYKINPAEWRNLMVKINESEAGLNSFFNDCKTNKALVKKWFIPTIEDQLNSSGDLVENIRELIRNHAGQLVKNEDMMKEREIFDEFRRESASMIASLEAYRELLIKSEKNKSDLGNAYLFIEAAIKKLASETEETMSQTEKARMRIKELNYQSISSEYYEIEDDLQHLKDSTAQISEEMEAAKAESEQLAYRKRLLSCVKLKEELVSLNTRIAKFEAELKKETLQQEDVKSIINDIRYSLKIKYQERIDELETAFQNEKRKLQEEENRLSQLTADRAKANQEISSLNEQLISVRGRIGVFDESQKALQSSYPQFRLAKNRDTDEYDADNLSTLNTQLDSEEANIRQSLHNIQENRTHNHNHLIQLEEEGRKVRDEHPLLAIAKDRTESRYQLFQKEKQETARVLRSYQLNEDILYDRNKILSSINADKEKYQKLSNDLNLENSLYSKRLKQYESGKAFELSDDLKKIFDDNNIFVEFGHDWLRSLSENKNSKLKLVKDNPFLPYALIVSVKDFEMIKDMELKGILSPVIPVIEREKLEKSVLTKTGKHVYALEGIHFLIPFDDRVLNKNYLKEICDEISLNIEKNKAVIQNAQEALNHIASDALMIESFSFTKHDADGLIQEVQAVGKKLDESTLKIAALEEEMLTLKRKDRDDQTVQSNLENEINKFIRKKEDITGFIKKCGQYALDLKEKNRKEESLKTATVLLGTKDNDLARIQDNRNDQSLRIANIAAALEKEQAACQKYFDAVSGKQIHEEIENLESKLAVYSSEVSGKIQTLQDILEDYRHQRMDKQKLMESFHIEEHLYIGEIYHDYEYESIKKANDIINEKVNKLTAAHSEMQYKIAERNSDLKYRKKNLTEHCGREEPLPRELIKNLDFEEEKNQEKSIIKDLEKKTARLKKQENNTQRIRFRLEEYRDFAKGVIEPLSIEGDPDQYVLQLVKEFKEYSLLINDEKNRLGAQYTTMESEFAPKSEMFKSLFHSILNSERKYQPSHALNAFNRVFMQIDRKLEQYSIDISKIDDMEKYIMDNTLGYLKNVYDEMSQIDRNSTIELEGKRCKMLMLSLPETDTLESISLKEYLKGTIINCVELLKQGKAADNLLSNEINTYNLFDRFVGVNKIGITLMKIEPNKLKKKTWSQVIAENSGGELFVSAFVVFISLLTYMRGENILDAGMESKVLIMDNPFGPITSEHLLKPLFEISKKYNTQMICLTDVKGHAIYDRFNLIYSLNVEREVGREDEYIDLKMIKKDVSDQEDEILSASMFKIEDKSRFELAN